MGLEGERGTGRPVPPASPTDTRGAFLPRKSSPPRPEDVSVTCCSRGLGQTHGRTVSQRASSHREPVS